MKTPKFLTSACRYCRYYKPEGRRGGMCQLLGVQVQASWKACHVAIPTFKPAWSSLEVVLPAAKPALPASRSPALVEPASNTERQKPRAVAFSAASDY